MWNGLLDSLASMMVRATVGCLWWIIPLQSARLAQWAACLNLPVLLRPKPPNRKRNVAATLFDDSGTFAGLSSNRLQRHDHV